MMLPLIVRRGYHVAMDGIENANAKKFLKTSGAAACSTSGAVALMGAESSTLADMKLRTPRTA
jgi:hypothetical protein